MFPRRVLVGLVEPARDDFGLERHAPALAHLGQVVQRAPLLAVATGSEQLHRVCAQAEGVGDLELGIGAATVEGHHQRRLAEDVRPQAGLAGAAVGRHHGVSAGADDGRHGPDVEASDRPHEARVVHGDQQHAAIGAEQPAHAERLWRRAPLAPCKDAPSPNCGSAETSSCTLRGHCHCSRMQFINGWSGTEAPSGAGRGRSGHCRRRLCRRPALLGGCRCL